MEVNYIIKPLTPLSFKLSGEHVFSVGGYAMTRNITVMPTPMTILGFILTNLLRLVEVSKPPDPKSTEYLVEYEALLRQAGIEKVIGPIPCLIEDEHKIEPLFPPPRDIAAFRTKDGKVIISPYGLYDENIILYDINVLKAEDVISRISIPPTCLITRRIFERYIRGERRIEASENDMIEIKVSSRLAIALDYTSKTVKAFKLETLPGALYYVPQLHPYDGRRVIGYLIKIVFSKERKVDESFIGRIGGRYGIVHAERIEDDIEEMLSSLNSLALKLLPAKNGVCKAVFLTPPVYVTREGTLGLIEHVKEYLTKYFDGVKIVKIIGEEYPISGFDLKHRRGKPIYGSLRLGSVLYFKYSEIKGEVNKMFSLTPLLSSYSAGLVVFSSTPLYKLGS